MVQTFLTGLFGSDTTAPRCGDMVSGGAFWQTSMIDKQELMLTVNVNVGPNPAAQSGIISGRMGATKPMQYLAPIPTYAYCFLKGSLTNTKWNQI